MLDFLGIIGWEKWVGWRLPPQTPLFRGKSQSPTFAIEWKNRNHYFYRAAAHRCNHYRQLLMRKWRKGPLASSNQPTWSEPESKRGVCHIFKLLSVQRKVSGFGRHTVKYKVVCCYWVVLYLLALVLVGYEKVKRTRQSQARGGRCYEGRLWNKQKHKVSITDQ